MIQNREMTMDDYLAMLRRRMWVILLPSLLAPLVGFAVSYAFAPKYTSKSTVLIEQQKVPEGYVKPVVTEDLAQRITRLEQRALSAEELRPVIEKVKLSEGNAADISMQQIREGINIQAVQTAVKDEGGGRGDVPGFDVSFSGTSPKGAQLVCSEITNVIIRENFADREQAARETTEFLGRQAEDAKRRLDELDSKLAAFKGHYMGQLPEDSEPATGSEYADHESRSTGQSLCRVAAGTAVGCMELYRYRQRRSQGPAEADVGFTKSIAATEVALHG
jgi:uncharacterized protein involved in exopolysaccharide biosynthesis